MPAFQFYPGDWIQDTRILTPATRGIWIDMLCFRWRSETRGTICGNLSQLSRLLSCTEQEAALALGELSDTNIADVTKCNDIVTVSNRRMVREETERVGTRSRVTRFRNTQRLRACNGNVTHSSSSSSSSSEDTTVGNGDAVADKAQPEKAISPTEEIRREHLEKMMPYFNHEIILYMPTEESEKYKLAGWVVKKCLGRPEVALELLHDKSSYLAGLSALTAWG